MTYCLAIHVDAGLVFCSDSRTNAGIDQISTYSKMFRFGIDGERQFVITSAGNLATTQSVIAQVKRDIRNQNPTSLLTVETIGDAADYIGELSRAVQQKHARNDDHHRGIFEASFIVGGQIGNIRQEIHLVYPAGNHITTSPDTLYLQIGESKYGKPILDRILLRDTSLETAALCALVSMDSTMRSNLTVGPPIELLVYRRDSQTLRHHHRFSADSEYLRQLKKAWDYKLTEAFCQLPAFNWTSDSNESPDAQNRAC
jgi:putative proteasome-type protease